MIVVADTGPIIYLVLIEAVDVLMPLYGRVSSAPDRRWRITRSRSVRRGPDLDRATAGVV